MMNYELYEEMIEAVCAVCEVDKDKLFTSIRIMPYPQARGLCWCLFSRITSHPSTKIAKITSHFGKAFTDVGIRQSISNISTAIQNESAWAKRWEKLIAMFDDRRVKKNDEIKITISVPRGESERVKFEIKET